MLDTRNVRLRYLPGTRQLLLGDPTCLTQFGKGQYITQRGAIRINLRPRLWIIAEATAQRFKVLGTGHAFPPRVAESPNARRTTDRPPESSPRTRHSSDRACPLPRARWPSAADRMQTECGRSHRADEALSCSPGVIPSPCRRRDGRDPALFPATPRPSRRWPPAPASRAGPTIARTGRCTRLAMVP